MRLLSNCTFGVENYKTFSSDTESLISFEKPITLAIGRNNVGKSALLDLLQCIFSRSGPLYTEIKRAGDSGTIIVRGTVLVDKNLFCKVVQTNQLDAYYTKRLGSRLAFHLDPIDPAISLRPDSEGYALFRKWEGAGDRIQHNLKGELGSLFFQPKFYRIAADRNLSPEDQNENLEIREDGRGYTNCIRAFLQHQDLPEEVVRKSILDDLNRIFDGEARFSEILVKHHRGSLSTWEIYLREEGKAPLLALSACGSGLKTILLTLGMLHIAPCLRGGKFIGIDRLGKAPSIFAFEELENNLHPALFRQLLLYLSEKVRQHSDFLVLTSHSSIAIDQLSQEKDSQIIHITAARPEKGKLCSSTVTIDPETTAWNILEDLGNRPSDILQANGVIWVEGPSDAIYLDAWIAIASKARLSRGIDYQYAFTGGVNLFHHDALEDSQVDPRLVSTLKINRNSAFVIDSDVDQEGRPMNGTKSRVLSELEESGRFCWITAGLEIENYIHPSILSGEEGPHGAPTFGKFEDVKNHLEEHYPILLKLYNSGKVRFAEEMAERYRKRGEIVPCMDLHEKIGKLVERIFSWNAIATENATQ